MRRKIILTILMAVLFILLVIPVVNSISGRTVKGEITLSDNVTGAEDATVVVWTTLVAHSCNCSTGVGAHSTTDSSGDYSILSNNLAFVGACASTGNDDGDACDGTQLNNDRLWIEVDGATVTPPTGNFSSVINSTNTWANLYVSSEFADVINGSLASINVKPNISSINISPTLIQGGLNVTILPNDPSDFNSDNLSLFCCIDNTNSCTPSGSNNNCTGNYVNQSSPYSTLSCKIEAPTTDDTYFTRCVVSDLSELSTPVRVANFTSDGTAPTTSDDYVFDEGYNNETASITITENCDVAGCNFTFYCTDTSNTCTPAINITGGGVVNVSSDGTTFVRYFSEDLVGNNQTIQSINVSLDFTKPNITDDFAYDDVWINFGQNITFNATDNLSGIDTVKICTGASCNPKTGATIFAPYTIEYTSDQDNVTLRYIANDTAGNPSDVGSFILKIDLSDPTTSDNYAFDGVWNNANASITITENCDVAGCNFTNYCTDAFNSCSPTTNITGGGIVNITSEGTTYLRFFSGDQAGNNQTIVSVNVSLDFTIPTIADNYTNDDTWTNASQSITLAPSDALSGVDTVKFCTGSGCNPTSGTTLTSPYNVNYTTEQNNVTIRYFVNDTAGNPSTTGSFVLKIDLTVPTTSDNFTQNDTWINYDSDILLTPNCDIADCEFTKYCSDTTNTCTPDTSIAVPTAITISTENITYLRYHSKDNAGNVQVVQWKKVKIDKTDTSISNAFTVIDNNVSYSTDATLDINWSGFVDPLSGIETYYINFTNHEGTTQGLSFTDAPASIGGASEGTVNIYVWAKDNATNIGSAVTDSIIVDLTNPSGLAVINITEHSGEGFLFYNSSSTTLFYSNVGNSEFAIQLDAADATSGLANASGETAFGDTPTDLTEEGGAFEYNLSYTIEVPDSFNELLTLTVYDLSGRSTTTDLTVTRDVTVPSLSATDSFSGWNPNSTPTFTWSSSDSQSGLQKYLWNVDNGTNDTITDTSNTSVRLSAQSDGNHTFYVYSVDNVGNENITTHSFGIDSTAPSTPSQILDEGTYDTDGSYTISWTNIADTSGITYTLYESINGGSFSQIASSLTSNSTALSSKSNNNNYTYKVSALNGAGLYSSNSSTSDGVLVDLVFPSFSDFQHNDIESNSTVNLTVYVVVNESESGLNATPLIRYKYGSQSYSSFTNLTLVSGNNYTYDIPVPSGDWVNFTGENVTWEFYAADFAGNVNTTIQSEIITSVNTITFNVKDTILQQNLTNVTLTGGSSCSSGCNFNGSITIFEANGIKNFNITKDGFSTNTTTINVNSQNYVVNVSLNDISSPIVTFTSINYTNASASGYKITIEATVQENYNISSVILSYNVTGGSIEQANFTLVENDTYSVTIGPFTTSLFMNSNITGTDLYGNTDTETIPLVAFVFVTGAVNVSFTPVLDSIGTQVLTVNELYTKTITASDLNNDNLTFSDDTSLFDIGATTGLISFTPSESDIGTTTVNITVSDGTLTDTELVQFRIGNNILELEPGWNLISTPELANTSIQDIFSELTNGNFGCGRGGDPLVCDSGDGDFVGNFSKIIGYNESASEFITFNPTDFYLSISNQTLLDMESKEGYWVNITGQQNITLILS